MGRSIVLFTNCTVNSGMDGLGMSFKSVDARTTKCNGIVNAKSADTQHIVELFKSLCPKITMGHIRIK